jgi:hypothetical protein
MKQKRILLFSRDPGGCNSVTPLYDFLLGKGDIPLLYGKDFSLLKMKNDFHLNPSDLMNQLPSFDFEGVYSWLQSLGPKAVITGTSYGDQTEQWLWAASKRLGIPSFAILDHWINYGLRFKNAEGFSYPDLIIASDTDAKNLACKEKIPETKLRVWGNPYYDFLRTYSEQNLAAQIRSKYGCSSSAARLISFASEPFSLTPKNYGYSEAEILQSLIHSIRTTQPMDSKTVLVVRTHPKESRAGVLAFCERSSTSNLEIHCSNQERSIDLVSAADLNCGMISQYLIESAVLQKPTLSIQIGLNTSDPFILSQKGVLPLLTTQNDLDAQMKRFMNGNIGLPKLELPSQCMENIFTELERIA